MFKANQAQRDSRWPAILSPNPLGADQSVASETVPEFWWCCRLCDFKVPDKGSFRKKGSATIWKLNTRMWREWQSSGNLSKRSPGTSSTRRGHRAQRSGKAANPFGAILLQIAAEERFSILDDRCPGRCFPRNQLTSPRMRPLVRTLATAEGGMSFFVRQTFRIPATVVEWLWLSKNILPCEDCPQKPALKGRRLVQWCMGPNVLSLFFTIAMDGNMSGLQDSVHHLHPTKTVPPKLVKCDLYCGGAHSLQNLGIEFCDRRAHNFIVHWRILQLREWIFPVIGMMLLRLGVVVWSLFMIWSNACMRIAKKSLATKLASWREVSSHVHVDSRNVCRLCLEAYPTTDHLLWDCPFSWDLRSHEKP